MGKRTSILDDGFQAYLTEGAILVGDPGIPMLMDLHNAQIPRGMIPFKMASRCSNRRQFVHFYMFDREFSRVLTATTRYLPLLQQFDGVITPDCSMLIGQSPCLQQTNTYMNRAVGFYLQKNGVPVIPNIRWSNESSFPYCFLGVPRYSMVCVSTHGCIDLPEQQTMFKIGMRAMIDELRPPVILVHGRMPDDIFGEFKHEAEFHHYPSQLETAHRKRGA